MKHTHSQSISVGNINSSADYRLISQLKTLAASQLDQVFSKDQSQT